MIACHLKAGNQGFRRTTREGYSPKTGMGGELLVTEEEDNSPPVGGRKSTVHGTFRVGRLKSSEGTNRTNHLPHHRDVACEDPYVLLIRYPSHHSRYNTL